MKTLMTPVIVALSLGLAACASQVPVPTTYPITFQHKMQAAHHWDLLTADVADRLSGALAGVGSGQPVVLYVRESRCCTSEFGEAFRNLLITHLMDKGFGVTEDPEATALTVEYDVQLISHNDRGFIRPPPGLFSGLAALAGSLFGLVDAGSPGGAAAVGALALDVAPGYVVSPHPDSEVIVTTSVTNRDRYVTRMRDIYYVSDNNVQQYLAHAPTGSRFMEVVGK